MATIKANVVQVSEFNNAKDIKLSLDSTFKTLKEGEEIEVSSINMKNVELQQQMKKLNKLFRIIEIKCMGHRAKPELFKLLLEDSTIEFELILHKAGELRANGEPSTFDYNEIVIKNVEFPKLDDDLKEVLVEEMKSPRLEKPTIQQNELLSLLYSK